MGRDKSRGPAFREIVEASKQAGAKSSENPDEYRKQTPFWCFRRVSLIGDHRWSSMDEEKERAAVYGALQSYGSMTWDEIGQKKSCHPVEVGGLSKPVLESLQSACPGIESAYQLRIGAEGRVFGVRNGRVLSIVLWDREHEGFPTAPRNT
jgi:hypothetical protein